MAAATASAADLPAKPVYKAAPPVMAPLPFSWTGFYVGGSAGYGWGRDGDVDLSATGTPVVPIPGPGTLETTAANVAAIPTVLRIHPKGYFGGGQIGYNYQAYLLYSESRPIFPARTSEALKREPDRRRSSASFPLTL